MSVLTRAFSLIELMVAIGLGMLIMYAAMAGIRVATQTVTTANRLSIENNLLQAGFMMALDEVDTWRSYDDPESDNPKDRMMRNSQMPFTQMPIYNGPPTSTPIPNTLTIQYPTLDTHTGWDPHYIWPPNDPRGYYRANMSEWEQEKVGEKRYGDYSLFTDTNPNKPSTYVWLMRQMDMIQNSLGYYAYCDYMPPSSPYAFMKNGDMERNFTRAGGRFRNGDGGASFAQGRYRVTKDTSFALVPLRPLMSGGNYPSDGTVRSRIRTKYTTGVGANVRRIDSIINAATQSLPIMQQSPESWPVVRVDVTRIVCYGRFVALNNVRWTNSLTGEEVNLSFTALGTTLRGARNMRKPGPAAEVKGWAKWYGPHDPRNDPTIDNPDNIQ